MCFDMFDLYIFVVSIWICIIICIIFIWLRVSGLSALRSAIASE